TPEEVAAVQSYRLNLSNIAFRESLVDLAPLVYLGLCFRQAHRHRLDRKCYSLPLGEFHRLQRPEHAVLIHRFDHLRHSRSPPAVPRFRSAVREARDVPRSPLIIARRSAKSIAGHRRITAIPSPRPTARRRPPRPGTRSLPSRGASWKG